MLLGSMLLGTLVLHVGMVHASTKMLNNGVDSMFDATEHKLYMATIQQDEPPAQAEYAPFIDNLYFYISHPHLAASATLVTGLGIYALYESMLPNPLAPIYGIGCGLFLAGVVLVKGWQAWVKSKSEVNKLKTYTPLEITNKRNSSVVKQNLMPVMHFYTAYPIAVGGVGFIFYVLSGLL